MPTINGGVCIVNGKPVDKIYSNGKQVYGRNITHGTTPDWQKEDVSGNPQGDWGVKTLCDPIYKIVDGETYTVQVEFQNATCQIMLETNSFNAIGFRTGLLAPVAKSSDNAGKLIITFTAHFPDGYAYLQPNLAFALLQNNANSYEFRHFKIETGITATPWTPAPEDVGITS